MRTLFRFVLLRRCGLLLRGTYGLIAGLFLLLSMTASTTVFGAARVAQLPLAAGGGCVGARYADGASSFRYGEDGTAYAAQCGNGLVCGCG